MLDPGTRRRGVDGRFTTWGAFDTQLLVSRRRLLVGAKIAVTGALLAALIHRTDLAQTMRILGAADGRLVGLATLVYLGGQALNAIKWRTLAHAVGFRDGPLRFVEFFYVGMFFNVFGLGTIGGDVIRAFYLAGEGGRRTLALNTVLADRLNGLLVLVAIVLAALLLFRDYDLPAALYWTVLAVGGGILVGWRLAPSLVPKLLGRDHWLRTLVEKDLAPYWEDYGLLARSSVISIAFHVSQIVIAMLLTSALGIELPVSYFFIFSPLVNLLSSLPVSWNGLGVREGGYVFFLSHVGVTRESAVAFGLLWFSTVLVGGLAGGVVYLRHRSARVLAEESKDGRSGMR